MGTVSRGRRGLLLLMCPQRTQKRPRRLPGTLAEQIVMGALWKHFDPLRLVRGAEDPTAHFHRDHSILLAVQDEKRRRDGADVALVVVFVRDQQTNRQPKK